MGQCLESCGLGTFSKGGIGEKLSTSVVTLRRGTQIFREQTQDPRKSTENILRLKL